MRILIVEDSPVMAKVLCKMCEGLGHTVDVAETGLDALAAFDGHEVVLMDLHLPIMDGWDTAKIILRQAPSTYIIACTSNVSADHQRYCYQVGMIEFLAKPPDSQALREALERAAKFRA